MPIPRPEDGPIFPSRDAALAYAEYLRQQTGPAPQGLPQLSLPVAQQSQYPLTPWTPNTYPRQSTEPPTDATPPWTKEQDNYLGLPVIAGHNIFDKPGEDILDPDTDPPSPTDGDQNPPDDPLDPIEAGEPGRDKWHNRKAKVGVAAGVLIVATVVTAIAVHPGHGSTVAEKGAGSGTPSSTSSAASSEQTTATSTAASSDPAATTAASSTPSHAPISIPPFDINGLTVSCADIGVVDVNEEAPIGLNERFGTFSNENGTGTSTDNNFYDLGVSDGGGADAQTTLSSPSSGLPVEMCVKDPAAALKPIKPASQNTSAFTPDLSKVSLYVDLSGLSVSTPSLTSGGNRGPAPAMLYDILSAKDPASHPNPYPAQKEAGEEINPIKGNWSGKSAPFAPMYNIVKKQLQSSKELPEAAEAQLLDQVDDAPSDIVKAVQNALDADLTGYAKAWANQEGAKLHTTVTPPSVSIGKSSGRLPSLEAAFLKQNPDAAKYTDDGLIAYIKSIPGTKLTFPKSASTATRVSDSLQAYNALSVNDPKKYPPISQWVAPAAVNAGSTFQFIPETPQPAQVTGTNSAPSSSTASAGPTN